MTDRPMFRAEREISAEEALEILEEASYCVISTVDEDGRPMSMMIDKVHFPKSGIKA